MPNPCQVLGTQAWDMVPGLMEIPAGPCSSTVTPLEQDGRTILEDLGSHHPSSAPSGLLMGGVGWFTHPNFSPTGKLGPVTPPPRSDPKPLVAGGVEGDQGRLPPGRELDKQTSSKQAWQIGSLCSSPTLHHAALQQLRYLQPALSPQWWRGSRDWLGSEAKGGLPCLWAPRLLPYI